MEEYLLGPITSQQWWVGLYISGFSPLDDLANAEVNTPRQRVEWGAPVQDQNVTTLWWSTSTVSPVFVSMPSLTIGGYFLSNTEVLGEALCAVPFTAPIVVSVGDIITVTNTDIRLGLEIGVAQ